MKISVYKSVSCISCISLCACSEGDECQTIDPLDVEHESDLIAEIREMIQSSGPGDDLLLGTIDDDDVENENSGVDRNSMNFWFFHGSSKPVTAVISSPGYISVLKKNKEKKEAEERKKRERRQQRLKNALTKAKEAQMRVNKLQKQVDSDVLCDM